MKMLLSLAVLAGGAGVTDSARDQVGEAVRCSAIELHGRSRGGIRTRIFL
jgi:hypothetical protein